MRQLRCRDCGSVYLSSGNSESSLCPKCVETHRKKAVYKERICIDCGRPFMGYPKSKRCPECAAAVRRENERRYKKNGPARKLGSTDNCQKCGEPYIVTAGLQRYCPKCSAEAIADNARRHKREYQKSHADPAQRKENKKDRKICAFCGKPFTASTPRITCSDECAKAYRRQRYAIADFQRGRAKIERVLKKSDHLNPQSGVTGITWLKHNKKWNVVLRVNKKTKYIGCFADLEEAKKALEDAKAQNS